MRAWIVAWLAAGRALAAQAGAPLADSRVRVDMRRKVNRISPWMYGSCIEDVNHEIYGGLYSQMIFGESFEEPPPPPPIPGWSIYGRGWTVHDGVCSVEADAGSKIVRSAPEVGDGTVSCDVRFHDARGDNAGLILRVSDPRTGADTWTGYEISLSPVRHTVLLGRHRNNWQLLREVPAPVYPDRWHRLRVQLAGKTVRIFVDDAEKPYIEYEDTAAPILSGRVGLRTWNSAASFRRLVIETPAGQVRKEFPSPPPSARDEEVSGMWSPLRAGTVRARFAWDGERAFNTTHSQKLESAGGEGTAGIFNSGLNRWGLTVRRGERYDGRLYLCGQDYPGKVTVALQSADGSRTYASQRLGAIRQDWQRFRFSLRPDTGDAGARFAVWIDRPGAVWIDQVFLTPTGRQLFHGLPVRADLGQALVDEGLTVLRYGGSMVNGPEYRWKKMIGDPDRRHQYRGWWYPYSTNGFGIEEFLRFCEAARFEPVFAINIEETPQDAADLVEYLNGPVSTPWGKKRAENGHPRPYGIRYLEIGNEEALSGNRAEYAHYLERFKLLYDAIHPRDASLQLIVAAWWRPEEPLVRQIVREVSGKAALWDVHVGGDDLAEGRSVDQVFTRMQALFQQWAPGTSLKACVLEENGGLHNIQRALGHARVLNATQRHGEFVLMDCPANCLQPWQQNDNGWDQGQLFFTSGQVWGMPPYHVQQMMAANPQPLRLESEVQSPNAELDVLPLGSEDGKTLVLRVVNAGSTPHTAALTADGFAPARSVTRVWELSGGLGDRNTPEAPRQVVPREREWRRGRSAGLGTYAFPPHSLTVLRFE